MRKIKSGAVPFIALCSCCLLGCSSAPIKTGFLQDYKQMHGGRYLDSLNINGSLSGKSISSILVETKTQNIPDRVSFSADNCKEWLNTAMLENADKLNIPLTIQPNAGDNANTKLELAITEINPGNASARMFAGEFGAGHAFVQVEGKLIDTVSGEVLATFVDRRRHSGAAGFQDLGGDSGPALVKALMQEIGKAIINEMKESMSL